MTPAAATEGRIRSIEFFRERTTGREFLFIWGEHGGFCLSDPFDVKFVLLPSTHPEVFHFDSRGITLKLHETRLSVVPQPIDTNDIVEFCD